MSNFEELYYGSTREEILDCVPKYKETYLDVGCAKGNFLNAIRSRNTEKGEYWGIEPVKRIAKEASKNYSEFKIINSTIEESLELLPNNFFNCITFNDVLEHLIDPWYVLTEIKKKLKKGDGVIIASIPNVRYIDNIKKILINKDWKYEDEGILDKTHLRFFTKKSAVRMFEDVGLKVELVDGINPHNKGIKKKILEFLTFGNTKDMKYVQFLIVSRDDI